MTRLSLFFFLAAIFFCGVALVTMEKVETIVTICTVIVAGGCVIVGIATLRRDARRVLNGKCPHCGEPQAGHTCINLSDILVQCTPHQSTNADPAPKPHSLPDVGEERKRRAERITNDRRRAMKG